MLDFLPPDGMSIQEAGEALGEGLQAASAGWREVDRTFWDTFDGRLHARGKSCVHEDGWLRLIDLKTGIEVAGVAAPLPAQHLGIGEIEASRIREALRELIDVRALLPVGHVHVRARVLNLLDDLQKTVVRISLEEPILVGGGGADKPLRPRLRLIGLRGYDGELRRLTERVESEFGFKRTDQSLVDEAVRAAGLTPGGVSSKVEIALKEGERADEAAARVLVRLLAVAQANLNGTIADTDSEFLHDFRVALRRSRAVQRELRRVFPSEALRNFRAEFRWLQQATGEARDLDVYVQEFDDFRSFVPEPMRADLTPLLQVLTERRLGARRVMADALSSERASNLLAGWRAFLDEFPAMSERDRPYAALPIEDVAAYRIAKVYRRMVKMGGAIDRRSPADRYHELRKKGKELRYLLELFGAPLFDPAVVKPMVKTLKGLQDVLGRHQDREVQTAMLHSVRVEVAGRDGGPAALMAMGVLVHSIAEDEQAARVEFEAQFDAFASKERRGVVEETFG